VGAPDGRQKVDRKRNHMAGGLVSMTQSPFDRASEGSLRDWQSLTPEQQLALREAFGRYLDSLPPTCSLETKIARFQRWLAERGVHYEHPG
jgi:hypothetical protein